MMKIPTTLKHKPVVVAEGYGNIDGRMHTKRMYRAFPSDLLSGTTEGRWIFPPRYGDIPGKNGLGSQRKSPLHRVLDLAIFVCESEKYFREAYRYEKLYDPETR